MIESLRVGEAASDARPPYGFDLYPDADVTFTILDGMSLAIRSDASREAIADFYESQLTERGWQIESREHKDAEISLVGVMPSKPGESMNIRVNQREGRSGEFMLMFMHLIHDR